MTDCVRSSTYARLEGLQDEDKVSRIFYIDGKLNVALPDGTVIVGWRSAYNFAFQEKPKRVSAGRDEFRGMSLHLCESVQAVLKGNA